MVIYAQIFDKQRAAHIRKSLKDAGFHYSRDLRTWLLVEKVNPTARLNKAQAISGVDISYRTLSA